jgi:hypothetical protein
VGSFLSLGYIAFYLRGGPRAPEGGMYWLEGRALSHWGFSWAAPDPSASFRVGGLLFRAPDHLTAVVPPGFPLLLAPAFLVGAPMLVGPVLASVLVLATWLVAHEVALSSGERAARAEEIARGAAALSVFSAALRQCTADAVPYGATALLVTAALGLALRARRLDDPRVFLLAGLTVGMLADTEPLAALPVAVITLALAAGAKGRGRALGLGLLGLLPGAAAWLLMNREATGHAFASASAAYFSGVAPGVKEHLPPRQLGLALVHGLRLHLAQVSNLEPIALLAAVPLFLRPKPGARGAAVAALVVGGQVALAIVLAAGHALRVPGTTWLLPVIPIEHALAALAIARLFEEASARAMIACCALSLFGFGVHASHDHERVAKADIGRPRFEPDEAREGNVAHGLLFFDDDEGYALAHDPGLAANHGVEAVRMRGDDHDRLAYDLAGHPQSHKYIATAATVSVVPWSPPGGNSDTWRFEAENDWPPAAHEGAWARVLDAAATCASDAHVLVVSPTASAGNITLALTLPRGATLPERTSWMVTPRVMARGGAGAGTIDLVTELGTKPLATWTWSDALSPGVKIPNCTELPGHSVDVGKATRAWLVVRATGGEVALDKTTLRPR